MGNDTRDLWIDINVNGTHAVAALRNVHDAGTKAAGGVRSMFAKITPTFGDLANAVKAAWTEVTHWISASEQARQADEKLVASLKAQGTYTAAGVAANEAWIASQSRKLALDDEDLKLLEAKVAGLTKFSGPVLNQATQATLAYAAATGRSAESSAAQVAKFCSGGTNSLRGLTMTIDKNATANERLAALTQATAAGYAKLEVQASGVTGAGARLKIVWEEVTEKFGKMITTSPLVLKGLEALSKGLDWVSDALSGTNVGFNAWAAGAMQALKPVTDWFKEQMPICGEYAKALWDLVKTIASAFSSGGKDLSAALALIKAIVSTAWNAISTAFTAGTQLLTGAFKVLTDLLKGDWGKAWEDIKSTGEKVWKTISGGFEKEWKILGDLWGNLWRNAQSTAEGIWTAICDSAKKTFQPLVDFVQGVVKAIEGAWSWLGDKLVWHSLIPEMNAAIVRDFERTATRLSNIALPWTKGVGLNNVNPWGAVYYNGGNMLPAGTAVKGSIATPYGVAQGRYSPSGGYGGATGAGGAGGGGGEVSLSSNTIYALAQAIGFQVASALGGNMRILEAQIG